ncbi:Uncharacterised protein [Klebsiella pneumoniae]|nr:Uncharacterised protein [Klebsiella pneumoniae]
MASGSSEAKPKLATVTAIRAKTPIGAYFMIMWVTLNMVSETPWNTFTSGSRRSLGRLDRPRPNITEKKMIGSISPRAMAAKTLEGIRLRMVAMNAWSCCTSWVVFWYWEMSTVPRVLMSMPVPGWNRLASSRPTTMATVVTISK